MRSTNRKLWDGAVIRRLARKLNLAQIAGAPRREDGATIVEMALACTILLGMLLSLVEVSLALYAYNYTSEAAREAARWAIVRGSMCSTNTPGLDHCNASQTDIQNYVQGLGYPYSNVMTVSVSYVTVTATTNANGNLSSTWTACSTSGGNTCNLPGNQVKVTVICNFPARFLFWRNTTIPMNSSAAMIIAQ
jgi:Flp pilus assembly protein TadG